MSKLDEMIQQYCPDGVEFKPIGDCVHKTQNIKWATADGSYSYLLFLVLTRSATIFLPAYRLRLKQDKKSMNITEINC